MAMNSFVHDKIIIGGGVAGIAAAYEIADAARLAGRPLSLALLTERINSPSQAGTNIVLGLDGFELDPPHRHGADICRLVKGGLDRIGEVVRKHGISCRHDRYYQLIAGTRAENVAAAKFLTERLGYGPGAFTELADPSHRVRLGGFNHALETAVIGQVNGIEFLEGLVQVLRQMGVDIVEGVSYQSHAQQDGKVLVRTSRGDYRTSTPPLLAGGPHLMSKVPGMPVPITPVYTIAAHVDLGSDHARHVCPRPVGFFNGGDRFIWGSLDEKNVLTFGRGVCETPEDRPSLEAALRDAMRELLPDLWHIYAERLSFSFNAMACTPNQLPIVGRLTDYDALTGNGGRGFAPSFAEARAYAEWVVHGHEKHLRLFENLNISRVN